MSKIQTMTSPPPPHYRCHCRSAMRALSIYFAKIELISTLCFGVEQLERDKKWREKKKVMI